MSTLTHDLASAADDPPLVIRCGGAQCLVVEIHGRLDQDATAALADVLKASLDADTTVVVDLTNDGIRSRPATIAPVAAARAPTRPSRRIEIEAIGPGLLQLVQSSSCWTVDVPARRLCRSTTPLDPRFVPDEHWTPIGQLRISVTSTTAVSVCGQLLLTLGC